MRGSAFFIPKIIRLCEKFLYGHGEQSLFKPGKSTFLLCEILGGKTMTEQEFTEAVGAMNPRKNLNMTNEETKQAVDIVSKPATVSLTPLTTRKAEQEKEVKAVAEPEKIMDPLGKFDYTGCQVHVVQDGESLFDVAQKYGVALQQLRYFNHVNKTTLRIRKDQKLYIPKEPVYVPAGE